MFEFVIDNRDGMLWNISQLVYEATWKTSRMGRAGSMEISFIDDPYWRSVDFKVEMGNIIRVKSDGKGIYYGYVFDVSKGDDRQVRLRTYDQIRYLMSSDTFIFVQKTATEVIQTIMSKMEMGIDSKNLTDTGYKIPRQSEDAQRMLDIIGRALADTTRATNELYVLYDDFGKLTLKNIKELEFNTVIGDKEFHKAFGDAAEVTGYKRSDSIDNDTYNYLILAQENKKTGERDLYVHKDESKIAKWGRLQHYRTIDERFNEAQVNQILMAMYDIKSRVQSKLEIDVLGDIRVRAGTSLRVEIKGVASGLYLVEECTHRFGGTEHTMTLELRVVE